MSMTPKQKAEVMVRCNGDYMLATLVEILVQNHNEYPTHEKQELLEELAKLRPDMVKAGPSIEPKA